MNRTYDLKKTMPLMIDAANASPPTEIVILDYNSQDDLKEYIDSVTQSKSLEKSNRLTYAKCTGRNYYHMAHARNLSVLASNGEYIIISSCDIIPRLGFLPTIRRIIVEQDLVWVHDGVRFTGVIACKKSEFIAAGGYDERFEFYGPEDKDVNARLHRRGLKAGQYREELLGIIDTPKEEKAKNYRVKMSKWDMSKIGLAIYTQNTAENVLVANAGKAWGSWE